MADDFGVTINYICVFLQDKTNAACNKTVEQPNLQTIWDQILTAQGQVVTYRPFKHRKHSNKHIAEAKYTTATQSLQEDKFGRLVEFNIPRAWEKCTVFVKFKPQPWPSTTTVGTGEFDNAISKGIYSDISGPMRAYLQNENHLSS